MKILTMLPLLIAALCIVDCCVSAVPMSEPEHGPDRREELGDCPSNWDPFEAYCYLVSDEGRTQAGAKRFCSNRGADLVKINSTEENEFVLELVREKAPSLKQVWIGLERNTNSSDFYWSDLSIPVYLNWAKFEPNGPKGDDLYVNMWVSGYEGYPFRVHGSWNDRKCRMRSEDPEGIVCKKQGA